MSECSAVIFVPHAGQPKKTRRRRQHRYLSFAPPIPEIDTVRYKYFTPAVCYLHQALRNANYCNVFYLYCNGRARYRAALLRGSHTRQALSVPLIACSRSRSHTHYVGHSLKQKYVYDLPTFKMNKRGQYNLMIRLFQKIKEIKYLRI